MEKLIITAAVTGGEYVSKATTPYVPSTIDEIVEEVVRSVETGASIVHLHAKTLRLVKLGLVIQTHC